MIWVFIIVCFIISAFYISIVVVNCKKHGSFSNWVSFYNQCQKEAEIELENIKKERDKQSVFLKEPTVVDLEINSDDIKKEMIDNHPWFAELVESNQRTLEQGDKLNDAYNEFKINKNYEDVIAAYEEILLDDDSKMIGTVHSIRLAEFYIATNQHDKAWGYLNKLALQTYGLIDKIRRTQHKILKKEKKYTEALLFLMYYYMHKNKRNGIFQESMFRKDANVLFKKIGLDVDCVDQITTVMRTQIGDNIYDEDILRDDLSIILKNI